MAAIVEFTGFDRDAVSYADIKKMQEQAAEAKAYVSAATILHDQEAGDAIQTPNGHVIASEEQLVSPDLSPKTAKEKTIITIAAVGLAVILLYNFFK